MFTHHLKFKVKMNKNKLKLIKNNYQIINNINNSNKFNSHYKNPYKNYNNNHNNNRYKIKNNKTLRYQHQKNLNKIFITE